MDYPYGINSTKYTTDCGILAIMESLRKTIYGFGHTLLAFLFPPVCAGCGVRGELVCTSCLAKVRLRPITLGEHRHAIFEYHNPIIRRALWLLKYHNRRDIAQLFGEKLCEAITE